MVARLLPDQTTIQRVRAFLNAETAVTSDDGLKSPEISLKPIENVSRTLPTGEVVVAHHQVILNDDYNKSAIRVCRELFSVLQRPEDLSKIDDRLSKLLECHFERADDKERIVAMACRILERLPSHPPPMTGHASPGIYAGLGKTYLVDQMQMPSWRNLRASSFIDSNVLRIAIHHATMPRAYSHQTLGYVNDVARLLEASHTLSKEESNAISQQRWFMIKTLLWTTWHRSVLLHISYFLHEMNVQAHMSRDATTHKQRLSFEKVPLIRTLSAKIEIPNYMCRWAYELCRTDRSSVTQDFRVLCERFTSFSNQLGPNRSRPRCLGAFTGENRQCDGSSPHACHRFTSDPAAGKFTRKTDQSAHTLSCLGSTKQCFLMTWDEKMYRSLSGARAVSISSEHVHSGKIPYCVGSDKTMAISHVWSHGQGGRPDTGFNSCLHHRYCEIARRHGCDSYWMDTPCIPEDHDLRNEAIRQINGVFHNSRLTLICDRDIMEIDIGDGAPSMKIKETILSIILVCDWNVRAWTFLEAMRGVADQHLLCKHDQTISLNSLINDVNQGGSVELACMFLTSDHLSIWSSDHRSGATTTKKTSRSVRYLQPEESACLLSRRFASRDGDDVTIWSLLCGEKVYKSAADFWKQQSKVSKIILTSFLISSAPRIRECRGLSWAPSQPGLIYRSTQAGTKVYFAYDGNGSEPGYYDGDGLRATWLVHEFPGLQQLPWSKLKTRLRGKSEASLKPLAQEFLKDFRWGALLQAINTNRGMHSRMKIAAPRMDDTKSALMGLIGSHDRIEWHWLGVHEWNERFEMPAFERKAIIIV